MSLLDALKVKQKDMESKRQRDFAVTPPPGNSRWRIMPSFDGDLEKLPVADFGQHFIKDTTTKETLAVVACDAKTYGKQCDICDQILVVKAELLAAGREVEAEIVSEAKAAQKHIVNAAPWAKNTDGTTGGTLGEVKQLALPMTAFEQFMLIVESYLGEGINIFDLKTGFDIIITRAGTGRNTKYTVQAAPTSSEAPAELLTKAVDLDAFVNQITEEKRARAMSALGGPKRAPILAAPTPALPATVVPVATVPAAAAAPAPAAPAAAAAAAAAAVAAAPAAEPTVALSATPEVVPAAAAPVVDVGAAAPAADSLGDVDLDDLNLDDLGDVT